jgi:hypothetical protein
MSVAERVVLFPKRHRQAADKAQALFERGSHNILVVDVVIVAASTG